MQFKNLALLAAATSTVVAEFVIITDIPTPTNLAVLTDIDSWVSSLEAFVTSKVGSVGSAELSAASSAHSALASFVATATYDIPSEVTALTAIETFSTTPEWYSALPSDVKSYYDQYNKDVNSLLNEAINGANATTTGASGTGASGSAATAEPTGAAAGKLAGVVGAGMAAAFAGVMAL